MDSADQAWKEAKKELKAGHDVTITLEEDWTPGKPIDIKDAGMTDAKIKLDLNGHTISGKNIDKGDAIFDIDAAFHDIDLTITNGTIQDSRGRAIYMDDQGSTLFLKNVTISGGDSKKDGVAIYHDNGKFTMEDCTIKDNKTEGNGTVYLNKKGAKIFDTTFENNTAGKDGGAIYINARDIKIDDCTFTGNKAIGTTGGVYIRLMGVVVPSL